MPIIVCKLSHRERWKVFNLYKSLFFKCLKRDALFKSLWLFVKTEIIVQLNTKRAFMS